jgi:hypothetical protein
MGNFPIQMSYSNTENHCLPNDSNTSNHNHNHNWFNQTGRTFDMNSDEFMFLPNSFCCNNSLDIPSDNVSTEMRSNINMHSNNFSSWGGIGMMENHTEEAKWENNNNSNYFHNPILMLASESLCNEIKPSMNLTADNTYGAILPNAKQEQLQSSSNIFSKDIQKLREAFGDM